MPDFFTIVESSIFLLVFLAESIEDTYDVFYKNVTGEALDFIVH